MSTDIICGTAQPAVHIEDRGLQLGDSVYEVCRIAKERSVDEAEHLERLERSLSEIEIAMPMGRAALRHVMAETVRRNAVRDGMLYLQITRGALRRDHAIPLSPPKPTLIVTVRALDPAAIAGRGAEGVSVVSRPDERWGRCDIKTTQLLPNLLAKTAAKRAGAFETWMIDFEGFVTEGASTNAWIVDEQGTRRHPRFEPRDPAGVTRRVISGGHGGAQISAVQRRFTLQEALAAREAFLSSATGGAVAVVSIDGHQIGDGRPGSLTRRIAALYAQYSLRITRRRIRSREPISWLGLTQTRKYPLC